MMGFLPIFFRRKKRFKQPCSFRFYRLLLLKKRIIISSDTVCYHRSSKENVMRLKSVVLIVLTMAVGIAFAQKNAEKYVTPTANDVGVFKNEIRELYEKPLFTVGTNDRLLILSTARNHYKNHKGDGETRWVEKRMVVTTGKSKTFVFDDAEVIGYLDNPTPVYIIDADNPNADPIKLDRSFADALRENVNRETVERQTK